MEFKVFAMCLIFKLSTLLASDFLNQTQEEFISFFFKPAQEWHSFVFVSLTSPAAAFHE